MAEDSLVKIPLSGWSMWPLFDDGDILLMKPMGSTTFESPKVGDVFIFKLSDQWVCHRYIGYDQDKMVFKGDYSVVADHLITAPLLGRVVGLQKDSVIYFVNERWSQRVAILHVKAYFTSQKIMSKLLRYAALGFTLFFKPLFYKRVDPSPVVK